MSPLSWWLRRMQQGLDCLLSGAKIEAARRLVADPGRFDVHGTDDVFDQNDPCADPNEHWQKTGCPECRGRLIRIRAMAYTPMILAAHFEDWRAELRAGSR